MGGRYLSSIGDLLQTVGALGPVKPLPAEGLGMGSDVVDTLFSGETFAVPSGKATINGLVNEYVTSCMQVRNRWPMGLGKYLMDRLEVYMNGGSVGLSNKPNDFASLAVRMSAYESALASLTSKLTVGPKAHHKE